MAAEGYIAVSRIARRLELLHHGSEEQHPAVFVVRERVSVWPLWPLAFCDHVNVTTGNHDLDREISTVRDHSGNEYQSVFWWGCGASVGCSIVPIGSLPESARAAAESDRAIGFPGMVYPTQAREAWARIVPGYWAVTKYVESGLGPDYGRPAPLPDGVQTDTVVEWEVWT